MSNECLPTIEQAEQMVTMAKELYDEKNTTYMTKEHDVLAIVKPNGTVVYLSPDFYTLQEVIVHLNEVGRGEIGDGK